jgi:hypothetical protein
LGRICKISFSDYEMRCGDHGGTTRENLLEM